MRPPIAAITRPPESRRKLFLEHQLAEPGHSLPHTRRDRIEPTRTIKQGRCNRRCAILLHGMISLGAPTPSLVVELTRRLRHPMFPDSSRPDWEQLVTQSLPEWQSKPINTR